MTLSINLDKDTLKYRPEDGKLYFTYSDIQSLPEWPESPLIELSGGELFVVPSPSTRHQEISGNLFFILMQIVQDQDSGMLYSAPTDIKLSDEDLVIPDLVFISKEKKDIIQEKLIEGAPDLIIEILSSNVKRDKLEKFELYQKHRVSEYVIVDPVNETISHFIFDENSQQYQEQSVSGDQFTISSLNNAEISITEIFR